MAQLQVIPHIGHCTACTLSYIVCWQTNSSSIIIRSNSSHQRAPCIVNQADKTREWAMRVVLADDHPIVLGGLRALLQAEREVEIVAAVPDGASALEAIRAHEPSIAVLDIS